jgi:hypothetical protein
MTTMPTRRLYSIYTVMQIIELQLGDDQTRWGGVRWKAER